MGWNDRIDGGLTVKQTLILVVILIILMFILTNCTKDSHVNDIKKKVESLNGTYIDSERRSTDCGPFECSSSKGPETWRFTYNLNGEEKVGWVKFDMFSNDWKVSP